ncbi:GNAT family N-acetyltransferase [Rhodohalobacter sp. SW132]|uniref:GNAT family N-acetyltransferase n=1 Tax=Rhodohalobacter sp. SW132 TaxID=2293433 RepID=UPI000E2331AE|nr:GNAT family N-acetyltransferase [Rhodohalobacter sp. SW132]REL38667.1 GNAT family N-acetyltransferase [Rhodohalobacter sp. SW132]
METPNIVPFDAGRHGNAFCDLNMSWLEDFGCSDEDINVLKYPVEQIIEKGGAILAAELDGTPVGVVALKPLNDDLELTKMAVQESARGNGIGTKLMNAAIQKALEMNAGRMVLFTDPLKLRPAFLLYRRFGFTETPFYKSRDCRCSTAMEKYLKTDFITKERNVWIEEYGAAPELLKNLLSTIKTEELHYRPDEKSWSVHQQIAHLADSEANNYVRLRRFVAEPGKHVFDWDQDVWTDKILGDYRPWEEAIELFSHLRIANYRLLTALEPDQFSNTIIHEINGELTLTEWLLYYKNHTHYHSIQRNRSQFQNRKNR